MVKADQKTKERTNEYVFGINESRNKRTRKAVGRYSALSK